MSVVTAQEERYSVIGHRVPKYDAIQKVTGRADYMVDLRLPGMLYGKILRSRHPHARIVKIDKSRAEALPGVFAAITAEDTPLIRFGFMKDNLPLKDKKVLSYRDEVAAVAAVDEETASKGIELIEVEYEPLEPLLDPLEAMKEGAAPLHEDCESNVVSLPFRFKAGDPDGVFKQKGVVAVENTFRLHFITHAALGTMGVVASYGPDGRLTMWSNTQSPFMFQREIAEALGIQAEKVRVVQPCIGGSFGRGMDVYPVDVIAALLSIKTGRPIKIVFSREEDLSYSPTRQPAIITIKTAASREGKLLARKVEAILDVGAYVSWGAFDARVMMATSTGQYRVDNVEFAAIPVYTNNPYSGTMRGAGNPQINFAIESQMDILAERLGIDPLEFRLLNANRPGDVTSQGMRIGTCSMEETLRVAAREVGWKGWHKAGKNRGVGFSTLFHVAGGARVYRSDGCGAIVKVDDFGKVTVLTGASEIGTGSDTSIAQIVAEELGVPLSKVEIVNTDTTIKPWDVGIHASRMTFVGGNAALLAARRAKEQILRLAADELGEDHSSLKIRDGVIFSRTDPKKSIPYDKLIRSVHFREGGTAVISTAFYDPPTEMADAETQKGNISAAYAFGTQAAVVEVDPETGKVEVVKVVAVHDAGRVLNPNGAEGQVEGGVAMSLSYALNEQLMLEEGAVLNPSLADYKLLTIAEAPEIKVIFVGQPEPAGPFGAKGVGEHGCIPTAAAVANAVYDAVGVRAYELPLLPERVLKMIMKGKGRLGRTYRRGHSTG